MSCKTVCSVAYINLVVTIEINHTRPIDLISLELWISTSGICVPSIPRFILPSSTIGEVVIAGIWGAITVGVVTIHPHKQARY